MYSIGKHMESKIGIPFRGSYDYKFNHLVIVIHFIGSCLSGRSVWRSNHKLQGNLEQGVKLILYLYITTNGASKIDHLERMEVVLVLYFSVSVDLNAICGLFIREDSTLS
jgi:hypothetical protein